MTGPHDPSDLDLAARIRRSVEHYRFERPISGLHRASGRSVPAWRRLAWMGSAAAAIVVTVAVLAVARPLWWQSGGPGGSASPMVTAPPEEAIVEACREEVSEVAPHERLQGEDAATALDRIRALPLLIAQPASGSYLLADDVSWLVCTVDGEARVRLVSGLRTDPPRILEVRSWSPSLVMGSMAHPAALVEVSLQDGRTFNADVQDGYWMATWEGPAATHARALTPEGLLVAQVPITTGAASPAPAASPVPDDVASSLCLPITSEEVLDDWLEEGEDPAVVADRVSHLPLKVADHRDEGSVFVFGDDRFVTACGFDDGSDVPSTWMRGVVEPGTAGAAGLLFVRHNPQVVDEEGRQVPGGAPDTLVVGAAAPNVARVVLVLEGGDELEARLAGGLWLVWWQEPLDGQSLVAYDDAGEVVEEVSVDVEILDFPEDGIAVEPSDP